MEKKTMYVVVKFNKNEGVYIYSRKNSNPKKMFEYVQTLKKTYTTDYWEFYVMSERNAMNERKRFNEWRKERERKIVEHNLRKYWFADYNKNDEIRDFMENR